MRLTATLTATRPKLTSALPGSNPLNQPPPASSRELDEADADILDACYAIWLDQADTPQDDAIGSREVLLKLRGVLCKKAGNDRRGGYSHNQLQDVSMRLSHLINFEVDLGEVEGYENQEGKRKKKSKQIAIKSRALVVSDTMG